MPHRSAPSRSRLLAFTVLVTIGSTCLSAETTHRPLAPPLPGAGRTLFTTLSAVETGLDTANAYHDPRMWTDRYREFSLGAIGTGLTAGDFDNDGRVDLYVVSKTEPSRLFRNLGGWRFEDVTEMAGVRFAPDAWAQGASFADINNDGALDLYVCRFGAPNLLFVNRGDGTFREEAATRGLAVADASGMAFFADYDRDGWLDVYLQTNLLDAEARPDGQADYLFRNRGDGFFDDVTAAAGISGLSQGHSATWWDYDEDGWLDLFVANDFKDPDILYRNNGDGTFRRVLSHAVPHTPHSSMGADLGDVNNDGHLDLLVADMAATTREKDHRGMAKLRAGLPEPASPHVNSAPQYMHNALLLGTGTTRTLEAARMAGLAATDWTWAVRLEDLDNDGWLDAYFTTGMIRELHSTDVVARMMTHENQLERIKIMRQSPRLDEANLAFRNRGDLNFEPVGASWGLDHVGVSFAATFADFDNDGDLDLVFSNYERGITVCRNDSTTGNRLLIDLRGARSNRFGVGARVELRSRSGRQVRQLVLGRGYLATSEPVLHFGLGEDTAAEQLTVHWPSGQVQVLRNLAANHRYEVHEPAVPSAPPPPANATPPLFEEVTATLALPQPSPQEYYDEFRRQPLLPLRRNLVGPAVAIADLDGDGWDDWVFGGTAGERGHLLSNLGDGHFLAYGSSLFGDPERSSDAMPLVFDANGDGAPDLLVSKGGVMRPPGDGAYTPQLFLNGGDGRFSPAPSGAFPALTPSAGPAVAADFDRDGRLDVVIAGRGVPGSYPSPADAHLLLNDGTRFRDVTDERAPLLRGLGVVNAVLATDVDDDGWLDLLIAREWSHVVYLRNREGRGFDDHSAAAGFAAAGHGFWRSLAAADFNGDGRLDYAAGNLGLNTRYTASTEQPALLFRGPLGPRTRIIEATYSNDGHTLHPLAAREQLVALDPRLARRFPTAESYARATLEDVVGKPWLEAAERFTVTELRHGIFLSQPDGTHRFSPLARLSQLAPIDGMVATDVTGDGHVDLVYVGNSYEPPAWIGRFDGGLGGVLAGDGAGGFTWLPVRESGWSVPHDGQALASTDLDRDGWPDFVATRHNHDRLVFRHTGARGDRRSLAVRVLDATGRGAAIGARVVLEHTSGRQQITEIAAGSGYLSQSSPEVFFGFPADDPPRTLQVRWPDGGHTQQPWLDAPHLTLTAPRP